MKTYVYPTIDPRIADSITLDLSGNVYKLIELQWFNEEEAGGKHHIFLDVVDEDGERIPGITFSVTWDGGSSVVTTEEKPGDKWATDFPMFGTLGSYNLCVCEKAGDGNCYDTYLPDEHGASDWVLGLGYGTPEHPTVNIHTAFGIRFMVIAGPPSPTPPSPSPSTPPPPPPSPSPPSPSPSPSPSSPPPTPSPSSPPPPLSEAEFWQMVLDRMDKIIELLEQMLRRG